MDPIKLELDMANDNAVPHGVKFYLKKICGMIDALQDTTAGIEGQLESLKDDLSRKLDDPDYNSGEE